MDLKCATYFVSTLSCHIQLLLAKQTMIFPVSWVIILLMFCTSANVFWFLVVSSGRVWPFSADSPHFWNPSCFHAAVCWQSQSLCLLEEWCKAHLLAQADRKKAVFKDGLWVALFFPELSMSIFDQWISRSNLSDHFLLAATLCHGFMVILTLHPSFQQQVSHANVFQSKLWLIFKHTSDTCSFTFFRSVTFLEIFLLLL